MKLLFITQKIKENDDDLAFVILWIQEFIRQGIEVEVICLEKGNFDNSFPVHSLGKEEGLGRFGRLHRFFRLIRTLNYDRVFVHMNPEYITLGGLYWFLRKKQIYLWYTHYTMHIHLWIAGKLCKRLFAATNQSLPQYDGSPKKVVTRHGIDISFWTKGSSSEKTDRDITKLISVHRICRSKRLERSILSLKHLPKEYTLDVYGRDVEKDYFAELNELVTKEGLADRVSFLGPLPMSDLRAIYPKHRVMVNMAMETIDKTMLEGMLFGIFPVVTPANAKAIGLPISPTGETSEDIANFILKGEWKNYDTKALRQIVEEKHSLKSLINTLKGYILE